MKPETTTINRDDLYKQVWEEPLTRLAKKYGISDVALKKVCKKLRVTTPPAGYWAKRKHGKRLPRKPPLPKLRIDEPSTHTIEASQISKVEVKTDPEADALIAAEIKRARTITVPEKLRAPHPLVQKTRDILKKAKPDEYGVLRPWRKRYLNIRVAPTSLRRALRIMNALIKGLEARGFQVETEEERTPRTHVQILGEKVHFLLNEKVHRADHVPTSKEKRELERYRFSYATRYDYTPTGKLTLQIDEYGTYDARKSWSDTDHQKIEELLNDFVIAAIKVAGADRRERLEREEYYRRLEEERRRREQLERQRRAEEERRSDLENQAELWTKSEQLRAYIREVEKAASARHLSIDLKEQLKEWLNWASQHVDRLDPLGKLLPFESASHELEE